YTTERGAHVNLAAEGIDAQRIRFVGNVMIDSLMAHRAGAVPASRTLARAGASLAVLDHPAGYGVVTLHRPSNVDQPETLSDMLGILRAVSERLPLICALHPRTRRNIERFGLSELIEGPNFAVLPPQGYLEMLGLQTCATVVLTDSGGMQEETTALSVPCLTLRENTERPITVEQGTNIVVGRDRQLVLDSIAAILRDGGKRGRVPELWDGHAAERIAAHLAQWLREQPAFAGA
ncbi:MAG TPA: UDP-N-acetylglucosamine 2-epimerase, partial [Burkholderiales bacterium]